ncbi:hypothetical protein BZA70DRAFT_276225 [Myxozyma melibiosi]|uniref:Diphthamide biosynthesis protein 4 n=1 Tax=Myxozyma melibiosi TaxID=54550 RepID=A0ABR1F8W3_9ASCO
MATSPTLYYDVLGLPPPPHANPLSLEAIRKAYRAALLRHHPDKNLAADSDNLDQSNETVDHIVAAYNTLSVPNLRADYDRSIIEKSKSLASQSDYEARIIAQSDMADLDDFAFASMCLTHRLSEDESTCTDCVREEVWYKECRCGDAYVITESMLVDVSNARKDEDGDEGEVLVQCSRCSTWLRVLFSVEQ